MNVKSFLTYEQQLDKLQADKLTISNPDYAKSVLKEIGYFSLINGYKKLFKHPPSQKYLYGVTFEELVAFYYFDEELRTLFLKYILHVERQIKSIISYHFCETYGESQSAYLTESNYIVSRRNKNDIKQLIHSLQNTISLPSRYPYITYHAKTYWNVPLWVAMNALTFGQVSKIYQYSPNDIRSKISRNFEKLSEKQLHQFLRILTSCRNVCAHGERLYCFHVHETIPDTPLHKKLKIPLKNMHYLYGKQDLFAVVISLRYLISNSDFRKFKQSLTCLINHILIKCPHLTRERLLQEMGFPINWQQITRYKK